MGKVAKVREIYIHTHTHIPGYKFSPLVKRWNRVDGSFSNSEECERGADFVPMVGFVKGVN